MCSCRCSRGVRFFSVGEDVIAVEAILWLSFILCFRWFVMPPVLVILCLTVRRQPEALGMVNTW